MTTISNAQLEWNDSGTPVSDQFDDVYFSNSNGLEETRYVFLQQNQLPQRWQDFSQRRFVIAETGFGTGLNFLAAWHWFEQFRQQNPDAPLTQLHFISFEKYPLSIKDLEKAHQAWPELAHYAQQLQQHYPIAVPDCHRIVLADGMITLDLWFGDIKDCMPSLPNPSSGVVDAWFLDGFAPSKNPEMWNQTLFDNMAKLAKQDCTCATFTAAGFVRRGLIEAGFNMKKVKGFGTKREMIAGKLENKLEQTNHSPLFPLPSASSTQNIAIIGGGIASASLVTAFARRGIQTTLFCKDPELASGASGNRQGAVYPLLNGDHSGVARVFAPAFLYARQFVEQAARHSTFDHQWCGVTQLMWDDKAKVKLNKMLTAGLPQQLVTKLDQQQTSQQIGLHSPHESVHYALGGWLSPNQLTKALINKLVDEAFVQRHLNRQVTDVKRVDDQWQLQWQVDDQLQSATFDTVILANGHEFNQLEISQDLHLTSVKGQVSHIPTTPDLQQLKSVLCYDGYMTPHSPETQTHCIGASYDRINIDTEFDHQAQQDNGDKLRQCMPDVEWPKQVDTSDLKSRQGIRCVSRDHLPFVGSLCDKAELEKRYQNGVNPVEQLPYHQNLYCFLGLGSRGLSSAPLLSELLVSQICGDPLPLSNDLLRALHPARTWAKKVAKQKPLD
ncbi:bifunctional tRNA (5-methylaminomethyl-2-thiouridine)(34)-methyltransferase MnmD/FAD-dependent 5-carboxymethylaminomethyl-2-thiouridine(34) oxidoreductase MnmC [Vibrio hippocampi]|uniref:tRNA 5-methylaminomethyl-2-thiouridine biosynthesis bifunctional protein MnmC n=1 Tax=Vibrio hippocampi TaxID=654686 RepID=A0ABN8DIJ8_9VIBR|nr:bifunctional tRNA (5-methylaminomethyl-2-thiouridine)(34)-methyltransferase MnmD/FAD-dependent 5-carboxymethylaminomethyl-2-thiouridine(34) oxidoreductase MnmC [Vibrio hippocampi]CAH0526576.1 tRNA 5-methylaminomethyl-2-thiouridine biosynthesis bifunctional protein MnmC [Vibrio hippocampi]